MLLGAYTLLLDINLDMRKSVLVTGAHGFLGRHVARQFSNAGYTVTGIGHGSWGQSEYSKYGITFWYLADVTLDSLDTYAQKPDVIVHCAGSGSVAASINEPYLDFQKTVNSTLYVLEYIRTRSPQTILVYPSSAAVYGKCEKMPIREGQTLNPLSPYGFNKVITETLIKQYALTYGVKASIVRLFSVYGPELRKQLLWEACVRVNNGENIFFGTGDETRDWLHVNDAARLLYCATGYANNNCVIVNGGSGVATTNSDVLGLICRSMKSNVTTQFNNQTRPGDPQHYQADMKSICDWDWKPKFELHEGVLEYVSWFMKDRL